MSDSEHSEGLDDLQELLEEYSAKTNEKDNGDSESEGRKPKIENTDVLAMEKIIFGDKSGLLRNMAKAVGDEAEESDDTDSKKLKSLKQKAVKRKPAWTDQDDENLIVGEVKIDTKRTGPRDYLKKDKSYKEFLSQRFEKIVGSQPKWAKLESKQKAEIDSDDELLRTVGFLEKPSSAVLLPTTLSYKHGRVLNGATNMSEGPIVSIQFHPTSTAVLIAGKSGLATIYAVDGRKNEKLHSMHFKNFPFKCVKISPCGTKAYLGSYKPYYYVYDLLTAQETRFFLPREVGSFSNFALSPCGRHMAVAGRVGELHLYDANSMELIYTFKQENDISGIKFTADSKRIICNSKASNISIFSISKRRIEHSFFDDGCIKGNVLDLSPNQRMLATGSMEGVVNVYDFETIQSTSTPVPIKTFLNLTTAISDVKFNHSSELLAMSSGEVNDAIKLAHFPSGRVYANFPEMQPGLGKIQTVEFSPGSGYLALGSHNKHATPYRLKHYNNY